ncbi:DUF4034 domain-containing protein [Achromobacter xylosoxidans]|uniref:DUF4034 domain-containing protein n=1 Tax=Alcaligenes xylosoxydans xylosoxydans TaxID=85698 RepID=UPI0022B86DF0|nr:DUF4034 domain-containing protein [Achromobacter xylosoxidans]MCZ8384158.1 DUF4034 domain-containing protein [Achromobacter xylosoxidans]
MRTLTTIRQDLRALVQSRAFSQIDAYYADLEQQDWSLPASQISAYSEAVLSGTLFDYSTVPYTQASDFLQAWITACPDPYHAHLVFGNFCFGRAARISAASAGRTASRRTAGSARRLHVKAPPQRS